MDIGTKNNSRIKHIIAPFNLYFIYCIPIYDIIKRFFKVFIMGYNKYDFILFIILKKIINSIFYFESKKPVCS